ncbi:MAG: tetratricopeptide repeat protein [bacterium]
MIKKISVCIIASLIFSSNNMAYAQKAEVKTSTVKTNSGQLTKLNVSVNENYSYINKLINVGNLNEAEKECLSTLEINPDDVKTNVYLGEINSRLYKLDKAKKYFEKVIELDPKNAEAHNGLGSIYLKKTTSSNMEIKRNVDKYYNLALDEFKLAVKYKPNFALALDNAGKIAQLQGKIDDAENYFNKALDVEPKDADAIENLGSILYEKGQIDAAIDRFQEAIYNNPKNSSAYYNLGKAYLAKGYTNRAINSLQISLTQNPNSAPSRYEMGRAYEMQGNEAVALSEYRKAILIKPDYIKPYIKIAEIHQNRGDEEVAIPELKTALAIDPSLNEAKLKIAELSLNIGKTDQALHYYKELLSDCVYQQKALLGLSRAYFDRAQKYDLRGTFFSESEYVEAEENIKQAIQYNPGNIELYLALLRIARLTNKDKDSQQYLNQIIQGSANTSVDHVVKGEAFITFKKYEEADNEFKVAVSKAEDLDSALNLGEIFITNRAYQPAKEAFNRVLSVEPNNLKAIRALERIQKNELEAELKLNVGQAFVEQKRYSAALDSLRESVSLNPNVAKTHLLLAICYEKQKNYYNAVDDYKSFTGFKDINKKDYDHSIAKIKKLSRKIR